MWASKISLWLKGDYDDYEDDDDYDTDDYYDGYYDSDYDDDIHTSLNQLVKVYLCEHPRYPYD
jgi:hypothetical protein